MMMMMMMTGFHQGVSDVLDFINQRFELSLNLVQQTSVILVVYIQLICLLHIIIGTLM